MNSQSKPETVREKIITLIRNMPAEVYSGNAIIENEDVFLNQLEALIQEERGTSKVTRVEVIDGMGRSYSNWDEDNKVELSFQDEGKTLKVFIDQSKVS